MSSYLTKYKRQKFKIGDWFYLNDHWGLTKVRRKSKIHVTIGVKLGLYTLRDFSNMNTSSVHTNHIHKIINIMGDKVYYNVRNTIEVK